MFATGAGPKPDQTALGYVSTEVLGLKWSDVDWLHRTISSERGVMKQIVDLVKSDYPAASMAVIDEVLDVLTLWRQMQAKVAALALPRPIN